MMMNHDHLFSAQVARVIQGHDLSVAQASAIMGYKSKTSLVRILRGEANVQSCEQCISRMRESGLLDDDAMQALTASLDALRMGYDRYHAWQSMWALLHNAHYEGWAIPEWVDLTAVEALTKVFEDADQADVIILNCGWPTLLERFYAPLYLRDQAAVQHHFLLGDSMADAVRSLACLKSIRFKPDFDCYAHHAAAMEDRPALMTCNVVFAALTHRGRTRSLLLSMDPHLGTQLMELDDPGLFLSVKAQLAKAAVQGEHLVEGAPHSVTAEDFVRLCELNDELEWKRTLYIIEPDLCMHVVPTDMWVAKLDVSRVLDQLPGTQDPEALIRRFSASHTRRYHNTFQNRCTKHFILSQEGIRRFAQSGNLGVHFFGFRPFTPEERITILENCLWHAEHDGHFNIHFWSHEDFASRDAFACYEGYGVMLFDGGSNLKADERYVELLLRQPHFANLFAQYIRERLLKECVLPYKDGMRFLAAQIQALREYVST